MVIDRNTLLFFDASCLIAASGSPSGGSGFLLSLCAKGLLRGAISQPVLLEAQRNIQKKLGDKALNTFYRLLVLTPLVIAPVPIKQQLQDLRTIVEQKDEHVLGACLAIGAPFLLTLDKRLEFDVNKARLAARAITPGEFIKTVLPKHADYSLS